MYAISDQFGFASDKIIDETMCDMWDQTPNRPPLDTHHPAVITHPVTGFKALNISIGWCAGFAELDKAESGRTGSG